MTQVARLRRFPGNECGIVGLSDLLCCWLLPLAMLTTPTDSPVHLTCSKAGLALATAAMLVYFVDFMKDKTEDDGKKIRQPLVMMVVTIVALKIITSSNSLNEGFMMCIIYVITICFRPLLLKLMAMFPQSFSFGEGVLVVQAVLLVITATCINHFNDKLYLINQGIMFITHCWGDTRTTALLISWWLVLTLVAVTTVAVYNVNNWPVNTATRKIFHLAVILVYIPGLAYDPLLLYTASLGATGLMMSLECLRWSGLFATISNLLNNALTAFTDSKEGGSLILTHIYLLVGVSLPLWVWPCSLSAPSPLPLYSGVLAVGVADSAASIVGSRWGKTKWFGSEKTVEGSVGAVTASLGITFLLEKTHLLIVPSWINIGLSTMATVMVEASTDQVDNLTLPLVMYGLLVGISSQ